MTRPASLSRCSRAVVVRGTAGTEEKHIEIIGSLQVAMELFLSYIEITSFLPALQTWSVTHSNILNVQEKVKLGFPMTSHKQNNNFVSTK